MRSQTILWRELRDRHMLGYDFERHYPIDRCSVDFYCAVLRLAIEVEGIIRTNVRMLRNCERRYAKLTRRGLTVLRFSDDEVVHNLDGVVGSIRRWIRNQPARWGAKLDSSAGVSGLAKRRLRMK